MTTSTNKIQAVPTNIITGFLGSGKTTAILRLLQAKPEHERWAILVNEFGEVGVDGAIVQGQGASDAQVFIREVPGGCMCCAQGLPMQIALTQLLQRAKPHRLLIEPTGLGHPVEVLEALSSDYNRDILSIHKTITLVDARQLSDKRYTEHATYRQQLAIADTVVANKDDLSRAEDRQRLETFVAQVCRTDTPIIYTQQGQLDFAQLEGATGNKIQQARIREQSTEPLLAADLPFPDCGYVTAINSGEGFESIGWRFAADKLFEHKALFSFLTGLDVERMKAVFITTDGVLAYNMTRDTLTETGLDESLESRIEIISPKIDPSWIDELLQCLSSESAAYSV